MTDGYLAMIAVSNVIQKLNRISLLFGLGISTGAALLFIRRYVQGCVCFCRPRMTNQTVLITGANRGIGFETAKQLATLGASIIIACRNIEDGEKAAQQISRETGSQKLSVFAVDLADLTSVKNFASKMCESEIEINILINNAGVLGGPMKLTKQGHEIHFGVNYLSHFLLSNLLLEKLVSSAPSRIINLVAQTSKFDDVIMDNEEISNLKECDALYNSKLALMMFTREMAKRNKGLGLSVNCCHPGFVFSDFYRNHFNKWVYTFLVYPFLSFLMKTPWYGAQTSVYLAVAPEISSVTGAYFKNCKPSVFPESCLKDSNCQKLWRNSEKFIKNYV